jgi:hypothetical protein
VHGDRVRIVDVRRVAPQLQPSRRRHGVGGQRVRVVSSRTGDADHPQPALGELPRVAPQIPTRFEIDELVAGDPDGAAVFRIPVALLVGDVDRYSGSRHAPRVGPRVVVG